MNTADLRSAALDIFRHVLRAVDARAAVRHAISIDGSQLRVFNDEFNVAQKPIYVVGAGKAALSMSLGINDVLGDRIERGVISITHSPDTSSLPANYTVFYGGHPLPNQDSLRAAESAFALLSEANQKNGFLIFLISGGGSAMIESPVSDHITLENLQDANRQLITCGATIEEINAVRRSFSALKGGKLAALMNHDAFVTLIISDTNRGNAEAVASGPTLSASPAPNPEDVVQKYGLTSTLPSSILAVLRSAGPIQLTDSRFHVLLDNQLAMEAAAEHAASLGFAAVVACDINEQPIDEGSSLLLTRAGSLRSQPSCLISGGEFSCRVSGTGRGGRNLETVLRCAINLDENNQSNHAVVLSAGTDGVDGSSFAAGAVADETTIARARGLGLDPFEFLEQSDSHAFFEALGDLIVTGPTGTNVRDLRIVLRG
jgi:hydroxypyruvate reductase